MFFVLKNCCWLVRKTEGMRKSECRLRNDLECLKSESREDWKSIVDSPQPMRPLA